MCNLYLHLIRNRFDDDRVSGCSSKTKIILLKARHRLHDNKYTPKRILWRNHERNNQGVKDSLPRKLRRIK